MSKKGRNGASRRRHKSKLRTKTVYGVHVHTRPGSVLPPVDAEPPLLRLTCYGPDHLTDKPNCSVSQIRNELGKHPVVWIDATGLGDSEVIEQVGDLLGIHRLALEDMVTIPQRSKVEEYPNHLFAVTQIAAYVDELDTDQVSFFMGKGFVLTWRERAGSCFDMVRKRLQVTCGITRSAGVDYLLYTLLDAVIDTYFPVLEKLGEALDDLDDRVENGADPHLIGEMSDMRHDVRQLRRVIWPLRDAIDDLIRTPNELLHAETLIHLRDCHDHTVQIIDTLENFRDAGGDLRDYYATSISNRMNEIMKVLTIISTIFMPLGFIAGVYGMNFNTTVSPWNMPELHWRYGYPLSLALMAAVAVGQLIYYRRRGWLGSFRTRPPRDDRAK
jgi:magnesium transporter